MAEIFRLKKPETSLEWTGERFIAGLEGTIALEHLHRYFLARELCRDKAVLDVAAGEGYGSAILAQVAASVVGVELDPGAVAHARRNYQSANLSFLEGSATALPLDDGSLDAVVSFETLEHFVDHDSFFREVRRVLRPGGFLLISTPEPEVYSALGMAPNPYHVREVSKSEFVERMRTNFGFVVLMRQRACVGSAVVADSGAGAVEAPRVFEQRDTSTFEVHRELPRAPYVLAMGSDEPLQPIGMSLYVTNDSVESLQAIPELRKELQTAHAALASLEGSPEAQAEIQRLRAVEADLRTHFGAVEAHLRMHIGAIESERSRLARAVEEELEKFERARSESEIAMRVQTLTVLRLQTELGEARRNVSELQGGLREAEELNARTIVRLREAEELKARVRRALDRVAPLWARRLVPASVRRFTKARILPRA